MADSRQWQMINRKRSRFFKKYTTEFAIALNKQIERVKKHILIDYSSIIDQMRNYVNGDDITPTFVGLYQEVGSWFAVDALIDVSKTKAEEDLFLSVYERAMEAYGIELAAKNVTEITSTTVKEAIRILRPIIAESIDEGFGVEKTARNILDRFSSEYTKNVRWRARRIAQTELIGASNRGTYEAARATGYDVEKRWIAGGPNVRDSHAATNGQKRKNDEMFEIINPNPPGGNDPISRGRYPGDSENLPGYEIINCHCAMSTRIIR